MATPKAPIFLCAQDQLAVFDSIQVAEVFLTQVDLGGYDVSIYDSRGLWLTCITVQQPNPGGPMKTTVQLKAAEPWPTHMPALDAALRHYLIHLHGYSPAWLANVPTEEVLELVTSRYLPV